MQFTPGRPPAPTVGPASRSISRHDMDVRTPIFAPPQRHTLLCFPTLLAPAVPFAQAHHCLDSYAVRGTCTLAAPHRRRHWPKPLRPGRRSCCCRDQASAYGTCGTSNETVRHGERVREVSKRGIKTVRRQVTCNRAIAPMAPLNAE